MNEAEWLACADPTPMLEFLRGKASDRKLRLFTVACCRLFWDSLNLDATRSAIETAERYADNKATEEELSQARSAAHNAAWTARYFSQREPHSSDDPLLRLDYSERLGHPTEEVLRRLYFVAFMANTTQRLRAE